MRRDSAITIVAVVVLLLALDDITTDNASSFWLEWLAVGACVAWFVYAARRFFRKPEVPTR